MSIISSWWDHTAFTTEVCHEGIDWSDIWDSFNNLINTVTFTLCGRWQFPLLYETNIFVVYFYGIYPSQRQNLLLTFVIVTHNFSKFLIVFKTFKISEKIPKFSICFQNFQIHKGAATDIKGAAASLLANSKVFIFYQEFPKLGVYNRKHNLARSCFQLRPSKSAPRMIMFNTK